VRALDKNLTIVSEAEKAALYGLPDFDEFQRLEYFAFSVLWRWHPDAGEAIFQHQLQKMLGIPVLFFVFTHLLGSNLRRIADPQFESPPATCRA